VCLTHYSPLRHIVDTSGHLLRSDELGHWSLEFHRTSLPNLFRIPLLMEHNGVPCVTWVLVGKEDNIQPCYGPCQHDSPESWGSSILDQDAMLCIRRLQHNYIPTFATCLVGSISQNPGGCVDTKWATTHTINHNLPGITDKWVCQQKLMTAGRILPPEGIGFSHSRRRMLTILFVTRMGHIP
jgi:hypothetical protein